MNVVSSVKWLVGVVLQNVWWKLLSLAIAVAIWGLVATEPEMETSVSVPLEYRNLPNDLEISNVEPSGNSVLLELRGPSGELRALGQNGVRPGVVLDLSGVHPGERTFMISDGNAKLPRGVHLMWARPSVVRIDFDLQDKRYVPVSVRFTGEGENGYFISHYEVSPKRLQIVGPESHVAKVNVVVSDPVDVAQVVGSAELHINAFVSDPYVRFASPPQVTVKVTMKKK